jgi:hypothetical protein
MLDLLITGYKFLTVVYVNIKTQNIRRKKYKKRKIQRYGESNTRKHRRGKIF